MIKVENLSLHYGKQNILNHISFSVEKENIIGLLGPNGAGKSSIIRILAGLVYPDSGKLFIENKIQPDFTSLREQCGFLIDSPSFYPYLTAKQNLLLIKKINKSDSDLEKLLIKVGLTDVNKKKVKHFSTGMKQRLAIAQALLRNPEILILDEPFNGLDPNGFHDLINLLKELNKSGTTIIVSSHLLNELEQFANSFILIHKGNIALNISKEELLQSKKRVAFTFVEEITQKIIDYTQSKDGKIESNSQVIFQLYPYEIATVVNDLVKLKYTPVNVETLNILQEKYLEITV
ncbi:MAG: ATP-binding cassette domain-containing protein [Bacteroidota bacterium]